MPLTMNRKDLIAFLELLDDRTLDQVFYPVGQEDLPGFYPHSKHPLHPDYRHIPQYPPPSTPYGLLKPSPTPSEIEQEKKEHAARIENERKLQQERIDKHRQIIEKNPIYKFLADNEHFKEALRQFNDKQSRKQAGKELKHPYAKFRFLRIVAYNVGFFELSQGGAFEWPSPDKRTLEKAKGHIDKLLHDFKSGVVLIDTFHQYELKKQLKELKNLIADKLAAQKNTNRNDQDSRYRNFVISLTTHFLRTFNIASQTIVSEISAIINCQFSDRTVQKIITQAKTKTKTRSSIADN